jgi:hypothetical protein
MRLALRGQAHDAVVIVRGLKPGMELSAGTSGIGDRWELAATDLPYAWLLDRKTLSVPSNSSQSCGCPMPKSPIVR